MELKEYVAQVGIFLLFCFDLITSDSETVTRFEGTKHIKAKGKEVLEAIIQRYCLHEIPNKPFPSGLKIYGRNVTCTSEHEPGPFRSQTWTCKDMRVDKLRMAYGYNFIAKNHLCQETKGFDELGEVCRRMMREIGSTKRLWVALVANATCDYIDESRVMLNMTQSGGFQWDSMPQGYGWIHTLQCMAVK